MSTDNFTEQLAASLNEAIQAKAKRNFASELSQLMYAESLNVNEPAKGIDGTPTPILRTVF